MHGVGRNLFIETLTPFGVSSANKGTTTMQLDEHSLKILGTVIKAEMSEVQKAVALSNQSSRDNSESISSLNRDVSDLRRDIIELQKENAKSAVRWGFISVIASVLIAVTVNITVANILDPQPLPDRRDLSPLTALPPKSDTIGTREDKLGKTN